MFEPRIIAFLCTWCSYTGADTAGIARMKSPANIRAVRVPCSGRVSPELIMRAFDQGADGVLVLGCHPGECHYDTGNHRTAKRFPVLRSLLSYTGLEPERLRLDWVSASEGERFARIATEFVESVRALGPIRWRISEQERGFVEKSYELSAARDPLPANDCEGISAALRSKAAELLANQTVCCVLGYEVGPRQRTRPAFIHSPEDVQRLAWNPHCSHNLTTYLADRLTARKGQPPPKPVAVVVKACDSRAVNVQLAESRYRREQVHVIGVACEGMADENGSLQRRCLACTDRMPVVYDTLIGEPIQAAAGRETPALPDPPAQMDPAGRMDFWLSQFDACIRCYACRQACPMCECPVCLYEQDDSLWVGMRSGLNEKRTFHLGRAYHLAGRCIGCDECERACPVGIPIGLLNRRIAGEIEALFKHRAGLAAVPSPVVTILDNQYKEES